MIPAQPFLIGVFFTLVLLYFTRLRSKAADGLIIIAVFGCSLLLVFHPDLATRLAHALGIGRGVDLIFYLAIPGLAFLILVLFSRMRRLEANLAVTIREQALTNVHGPHLQAGTEK